MTLIDAFIARTLHVATSTSMASLLLGVCNEATITIVVTNEWPYRREQMEVAPYPPATSTMQPREHRVPDSHGPLTEV